MEEDFSNRSQHIRTPIRVFPKRKDFNTPLPLPKGDTPYARAKRAQYISKDLTQAKALYFQAIAQDQRVQSAVKDIASILHQEHKTKQACDFLLSYRHVFTDQFKFQNLYTNLQRQIKPTGNSVNKILMIQPVNQNHTIHSISCLFRKSDRIGQIVIKDGYALLYFSSHSAARKTLESFLQWKYYSVYWVTQEGTVSGQASQGYTFAKGSKLAMAAREAIQVPIEPERCERYEIEEQEVGLVLSRGVSENTAEQLLGKSLLDELIIQIINVKSEIYGLLF